MQKSKKSEYLKFLMINTDKEVRQKIGNVMRENPKAFILFYYFITVMNNAGNIEDQSKIDYENIKNATGFSNTTIYRLLKILIKNELIISSRDSINVCNNYSVNPKICWKSTLQLRRLNNFDDKSYTFDNFVQMNNTKFINKSILEDAIKCPVAFCILFILIFNMDMKNKVISCDYKTIMEELEIKQSYLQLGLKFLRDNNYINIQRTGRTNIYMINPAIVKSNNDIDIEDFAGNSIANKEE